MESQGLQGMHLHTKPGPSDSLFTCSHRELAVMLRRSSFARRGSTHREHQAVVKWPCHETRFGAPTIPAREGAEDS